MNRVDEIQGIVNKYGKIMFEVDRVNMIYALADAEEERMKPIREVYEKYPILPQTVNMLEHDEIMVESMWQAIKKAVEP